MGRHSEGCAQIAMGMNHWMEQVKVGPQGVYLPRADQVLEIEKGCLGPLPGMLFLSVLLGFKAKPQLTSSL